MSDEKEVNPFQTEEGKEWVKSVLKEQEIKVNFTKKDGTERVLTCTLNPSLIPQKVTESEVVEGKPERAKSEDALAVYDTENQGWRSFRWDSVISVTI